MKRAHLLSMLMLLCICSILLSACGKQASPASPPLQVTALDIDLKQTLVENLPIQGVTDASLYNGNIYLCDKNANRVLCFDENFVLEGSFGSTGSREAELLNPQGVVADASGIHVLDWGNRRVSRFDSEGKFIENIPITETGDSHTLLFGFAHRQGQYYVSCTMSGFEPKLLIVNKTQATKALKAPGAGGFFEKDGTPHLLVKMAVQKESGESILTSAAGGGVYALKNDVFEKAGESYGGLALTPFVRFGEGFAAFSAALGDIGSYDPLSYELRGSLCPLRRLYPHIQSISDTRDVLLESGGDALFLVWPSEGRAAILRRKAE